MFKKFFISNRKWNIHTFKESGKSKFNRQNVYCIAHTANIGLGMFFHINNTVTVMQFHITQLR